MTQNNILSNPFRTASKPFGGLDDIPFPSVDAEAAIKLLSECLPYSQTPLSNYNDLAALAGVEEIWIKDETQRMGLGSFKALGAAYVIAHEAANAPDTNLETSLIGQTFVTASAGNHGLSLAAGAKTFGAKAVIYLSETVPSAFAERLRGMGAEVRVEGPDYEASMQAASNAADNEQMTLLSDSSWSGYTKLPHRLMEGYLAMASEITNEMPKPPTHVFLQAGVGGMAGAVAAWVRNAWGDTPTIVIVEPQAAPALQQSIAQGQATFANGPVSNMGRLDCKEPSLIALKGLARDADFFMTITDDQASETVELLSGHGLVSTPSGVAGLAGLMSINNHAELGLDAHSRALCIVSEGAEGGS